MKKHIYFIFLLFATFACKAQNPVCDISDVREGTEGSYYKDLNNVLNGYDGTYLYTGPNNTSFKIVLKKKVLSHGYYYEDLIVGEFQFIRNGFEVTNTLANIDINYANEKRNHKITGNRMLTGTVYGCPDCSPTEKRLRLGLIDNKSHNIVGLDIRKTTVNGAPAIKVFIFAEEYHSEPNPDGSLSTASYMLDLGEYIMIKQ